MKLSTSTNLICERPGGRILPLTETLRWIASANIPYGDMSFYEYAYPGGVFLSDRWEEWIEEAAETAQRLGLSFYQSHAYTYNFLDPRFDRYPEERAYQETLVERSLTCCRILGAKVIVTHPAMDASQEHPISHAWEKNRIYLTSYAECAAKNGMTVAVENMFSYSGNPVRKFFSEPEEMVAFIDTLGDNRIGICWDFEHGAILGQDQPSAIRSVGNKLFATHVSDAVSGSYEPYMHVLPFTGETDWESIRAALLAIGYDGAFSFEAHNFLKRIPDGLIPSALAYVGALGTYLTSSRR